MKPSIFLYYSCLLLNFILPSFLPVPVQAADATMASKYIHEDYGFALSFPRQLLLCTTPAPAPNHGFAALLRPGSCSDNTLTAQARIELYAGYEVSDATSSAALAGVICQGKAARLARLAGVKADVYQCTQKTRGKFIHEAYYLLHRSATGTAIFINLDLYTDHLHLPEDRQLLVQMWQKLVWQ